MTTVVKLNIVFVIQIMVERISFSKTKTTLLLSKTRFMLLIKKVNWLNIIKLAKNWAMTIKIFT